MQVLLIVPHARRADLILEPMVHSLDDADKHIDRLFQDYQFDQTDSEKRYLLQSACGAVRKAHAPRFQGSTAIPLFDILLRSYLALDDMLHAFDLVGSYDLPVSLDVMDSLSQNLTLQAWPTFKAE